VRVFAALPLPPTAAAALASALEPLRSANPGFRWVNAAGYHITLHFFGEIGTDRVEQLKRALSDPALRGPQIPARLGSIGQFPPRGSPRVVWISLARGSEEARQRWDLFEGTVAPLGWQPDPRGFTPHVTAGRAGRDPVDIAGASLYRPPEIDFAFTEIVLFESVPGRGGSVYNPLARAPFDGTGA
jgi:2'-5' RNA ligase